MLFKKNTLAVCIISSNPDLLRISLPPLGRLGKNFTAIIYNTNPEITLTKSDVRAMGYSGPTEIINAQAVTGKIVAVAETIKHITEMKNRPAWVIFLNECDMLISDELPDVSTAHCAVIQNAVEINSDLGILMRVLANPAKFETDGKNVIHRAPAGDIFGILIRTDALISACTAISNLALGLRQEKPAQAAKMDDTSVIWQIIRDAARADNSTPIYMDRVNRIKINSNFGSKKQKSKNI